MKVIQLGVGGFGQHWANILANNKNAEVVALVDISQKELDKCRIQFNYPASICFTDLDRALAAVKADILVCVTPPAVHLEQTSKAMAAGLHVICEKPMATTMEDCVGMLEASRKYGRNLIISQNYRYFPDMFTVAHLIKQGAIGEIGQIKLDFYKGWYFDTSNFRQQMPHPIIIDMSIHHFDLLRFMTSLEAETVRGISWNPAWSDNLGDTSASLHFNMSNGAHFVYNASWCAQGDFCNWNGNWLIEGDKGSILYANDTIILHRAAGRYTVSGTEIVKPIKMTAESQHYLFNQFVKSIEEGTAVTGTTVADNIRSIAMVFASVTAVDSNTAVPVLSPELKQLLA